MATNSQLTPLPKLITQEEAIRARKKAFEDLFPGVMSAGGSPFFDEGSGSLVNRLANSPSFGALNPEQQEFLGQFKSGIPATSQVTPLPELRTSQVTPLPQLRGLAARLAGGQAPDLSQFQEPVFNPTSQRFEDQFRSDVFVPRTLGESRIDVNLVQGEDQPGTQLGGPGQNVQVGRGTGDPISPPPH